MNIWADSYRRLFNFRRIHYFDIEGGECFCEGNFRALFESIEADRLRRGVIRAEP